MLKTESVPIYSQNYNVQSNKFKKNNTKKTKTVLLTSTAVAVGALTFMSYKGLLGQELQKTVNDLFLKIKKFFEDFFKKQSKDAAVPISKENPQNSAPFNNDVKLSHQAIEMPTKQIVDLANKAKSLKHELISLTDSSDGLISLLSSLSFMKINDNISEVVVGIMSKTSKLEDIVIEYNSVMNQHNSLVQKWKYGSLIDELPKEQTYLKLIQRAYQVQDAVEYDKNGCILFTPNILNVVSSWS